MTVEYIVLGALLIVMGGVQTWLRHGPGAKALRTEEEAVAARRGPVDAAAKADRRGKKVWSSWTAILGGVSVVLGLALVVMGALGR
jgi:hypothetical protein